MTGLDLKPGSKRAVRAIPVAAYRGNLSAQNVCLTDFERVKNRQSEMPDTLLCMTFALA
jgi:hypothetical protein